MNVSLLFNVLLSTKLFQKTTRSTNENLDNAKVTRVMDGDTFDIDDGTRIRLFEINAPEYPKDCMGIDAKVRLEDLILNKAVRIDKIRKDHFGRTLSIVYLDIKGNYRSADNTRIYHTSDCYNYDKITVKPGTSDRWFCTEKEAIAANFRKSLDCPK